MTQMQRKPSFSPVTATVGVVEKQPFEELAGLNDILYLEPLNGCSVKRYTEAREGRWLRRCANTPPGFLIRRRPAGDRRLCSVILSE